MFAVLARRFARLSPRRRLQLGSAAVVVLTLLLVFLFLRSEGVDPEENNRVMLELRELGELDAEWDASVLRAHIGRGPGEERLLDPARRMRELHEQVGQALPMARGKAAHQAYADLARALETKERLVRQFARNHPPLREALLYVPTAVADLKTELAGIGGALAPGRVVLDMDAALNELLAEVLRFNLEPTPTLAASIESTLRDIESRQAAFSPVVVDMIDALARHTRTILVNRPLENALEEQIAEAGTGQALERLIREFDRSFGAVLLERQRFRGYLFAYSVLLLVLLAWAGARLRRSYRIIGEVNQRLQAANETLEQRVAERTAELEAQSRQLERLAQHDGLTGLVNARQMTRLLERALVRAARRDTVVVAMFIDLDGFKAVNDTWGHSTGDMVLQQVAWRVQDKLRKEDTMARIGGDEFVILLEEVGTREGALRVAQLALDQIASITEADGHPVRISASIGIASARGRAGVERGAPPLLADADKAMYEAKQKGKGVFVVSPNAAWL